MILLSQTPWNNREVKSHVSDSEDNEVKFEYFNKRVKHKILSSLHIRMSFHIQQTFFNGEDWYCRSYQHILTVTVVEFCVQDLLDSVEEVLYKETCSAHSVLTEEDFNLHLGHRYTGTCSHCLADYYMVEQRCADIYF